MNNSLKYVLLNLIGFKPALNEGDTFVYHTKKEEMFFYMMIFTLIAIILLILITTLIIHSIGQLPAPYEAVAQSIYIPTIS